MCIVLNFTIEMLELCRKGEGAGGQMAWIFADLAAPSSQDPPGLG